MQGEPQYPQSWESLLHSHINKKKRREFVREFREIASTTRRSPASMAGCGLTGREKWGSTKELPRRGSLGPPPMPLEVTAGGGTGALPLAVPHRETCFAMPRC